MDNSNNKYQQAIKKINDIYQNFLTEMDRLKKERRALIADIEKSDDERKISEILKKIK